MIKLIVGLKGSGKTKQLIELVNTTAAEQPGSVLCIERGHSLTFSIDRGARLIDYSEFPLKGFNALKGFIFGCYAQNYDLVHIYIDNLFNLSQTDDPAEFILFLKSLSEKGKELNIDFTITVSRDISELPEEVKQYI